ncbi:MAG: hypothetical protein ABGX27_04960 [Desulfurobacteriaceae bacterium]
MIRWFVIFLETAVLIYILFKNKEFKQLIQRFLSAIPSSTELKLWILKGAGFGAYLIVVLSGIAIIGVILYYLTPYVRIILNKEALVEKWKKEFLKAKQAEINEIEKLKQETKKKLQEARKREQELRQQITHYQHLSHQLKQKEVELEIEFQQKRGSYLQELDGLQKRNRELQIRIKKLKEQLKSCKEKLQKKKS